MSTYIRAYIPTYIQTHTYTHTYLPIYIHTHTRAYIHTYICTYVHRHTYIHTIFLLENRLEGLIQEKTKQVSQHIGITQNLTTIQIVAVTHINFALYSIVLGYGITTSKHPTQHFFQKTKKSQKKGTNYT